MSREKYIKELENVYRKYYRDANGLCKYYSRCKEGIPNNQEKFQSDRALVGVEYGEDPSIPNIVVVGLEGLGKAGIIQSIDYPSETVYNPHYKGVRYILAYIFSKIAGATPPSNSLKSELIRYSDYVRKYTLLNCYKCAFDNKAQGLPHTDEMKLNCQRILCEEIKALNPDFLIIQVKNNRPENLAKNICDLYEGCLEIVKGDDSTGVYKIPRRGANPLLLIWTYHGSSDPDPKKRAWTNDYKNGCKYIKDILNDVLDKAIEEYKKYGTNS